LRMDLNETVNLPDLNFRKDQAADAT
jgi:hypothetical protein